MIPLGPLALIRPWMVWVAAALGCVLLVLQGANRVYSNGYTAGQLHERAAAQEALDTRQREDQRLAGQLAATARAEAAAWRDNAYRLQTENRRARTLVALAPACDLAAAATADPGRGIAGPGLAAPGQAPAARGAGDAQLSAQLPGGLEFWLAADAVRMWDSALAGRPVPAGACGADGAPAAACAASTAVTLDDAWDNHTENATRCGIDRARHQRLIEFLQARQRALPQPATP